MASSPASSSMSRPRSIFTKRLALLSQMITPKPKVGANGLRAAYMLKKSRYLKPKSGGARISAERKFVQGLGYIRADATPIRSRAAKSAASGRNSHSSIPVEATDLQVTPIVVVSYLVSDYSIDLFRAHLQE
ncbi:unnamed protein product [Rhizoctonia solani]|uniref:Uncharacterized protein n=1 Tax=Rhizoctonia solani TaxID=456999 RepID=A0A8H2Y2F9_9AGAM|nr:unnamed protein product [Rhizoctonia solani]